MHGRTLRLSLAGDRRGFPPRGTLIRLRVTNPGWCLLVLGACPQQGVGFWVPLIADHFLGVCALALPTLGDANCLNKNWLVEASSTTPTRADWTLRDFHGVPKTLHWTRHPEQDHWTPSAANGDTNGKRRDQPGTGGQLAGSLRGVARLPLPHNGQGALRCFVKERIIAIRQRTGVAWVEQFNNHDIMPG